MIFWQNFQKKGIEEESTTDRLNITKEFVSPLVPKKRRPISDSFKQLLDSGVDSVRIIDGKVNFVLKVKDIEEISYSKLKDVVYLNFKAPSELVLRNFYPEGALVNNFVVDSYVTFSAA